MSSRLDNALKARDRAVKRDRDARSRLDDVQCKLVKYYNDKRVAIQRGRRAHVESERQRHFDEANSLREERARLKILRSRINDQLSEAAKRLREAITRYEKILHQENIAAKTDTTPEPKPKSIKRKTKRKPKTVPKPELPPEPKPNTSSGGEGSQGQKNKE